MSKRLFVLSAVVFIAALCPPSPAGVPLIPGVTSPTYIIKLIDALTRRDKPTLVEATHGATLQEGKLLVARKKMDVRLERSSHNWRGRMVVTLIVPSDITYTVDLRAIRAEHLRLDESKTKVVVTMPTPCVEDVVPMLTEITVDDGFRHARTKLLDRKVALQLQNDMLKKDLLPQTRLIAECTPDVREQARQALGELLTKVFAGAGVRLEVVVE